MPHIPSTGVDAGPSSQILDHRPEIRAAWDALEDALLGPGSTLPVSLKENVRRALATDLKIGSNMLGAMFGLDPSTEDDRREYEAMRAERAVAQA